MGLRAILSETFGTCSLSAAETRVSRVCPGSWQFCGEGEASVKGGRSDDWGSVTGRGMSGLRAAIGGAHGGDCSVCRHERIAPIRGIPTEICRI